MPGGWIPNFKGLYFDPASWDGADMFMERPDALGNTSSVRYVTERVVTALMTARIRNIRLVAAPDKVVYTGVYTVGLQHKLPKDLWRPAGQSLSKLECHAPAMDMRQPNRPLQPMSGELGTS